MTNPAVLPGDDITAFYAGWIHDTSDLNGAFVFKYTIHGTLNGAQANLTVTSPPIVMTP